eukprot:2138419-Amphidinium_carterae.1
MSVLKFELKSSQRSPGSSLCPLVYGITPAVGPLHMVQKVGNPQLWLGDLLHRVAIVEEFHTLQLGVRLVVADGKPVTSRTSLLLDAIPTRLYLPVLQPLTPLSLEGDA